MSPRPARWQRAGAPRIIDGRPRLPSDTPIHPDMSHAKDRRMPRIDRYRTAHPPPARGRGGAHG